jgi:hypothetical protein
MTQQVTPSEFTADAATPHLRAGSLLAEMDARGDARTGRTIKKCLDRFEGR